jgi:hypothetical protein
MEPGNRSWALVEPVCDVIDIYNGPAAFLESIKNIRRPAALLYASLFCDKKSVTVGSINSSPTAREFLHQRPWKASKLLGNTKSRVCCTRR